jgi:TolB-like protein
MAEPKDTLAAWVTPTPTGSVPTPPAAPLLGGRYEILGLIGIGGMGSVYKALDRELDEHIALKMLRPDLVAVSGALDRFRQEVKLARRVTHPNVVRTFDLGEHGDQRFLTMELVEGTSLARRLEERGRFSAAETVRIGRAIAEGIAAAHDAGVLHRDLKPDNVLVTDTRVVITDFGIARAAASAKTMGGTVGTPAYMAPEQVQGGVADARTDLYAVGAILFELLVGRRAWPGEEPFAVALARLQQPPPDPSAFVAVPEALAAIVRRCLARDPADRFPDARSLLAALQAVNAPLPSMNPAPVAAPGLPSPSGKSIAVLPLRNAGPPDDNYLAEALSEEIIDALSVSEGLRVRPLGALGAVDREDPAAAGKRLGVEVVADGSIRRLGGRLRLAARAINVSDGFQIWAQRFDIAEAEAIQAGESVARALAAALTVDLRARTPVPGLDPRAVDLYLRGRAELAEGFGADPTRLPKAVEMLEQAAVLAPDDPNILSALATAHARRGFYAGTGALLGEEAPHDALEHARAVAERAVTAGPTRAEAWTALATVRLYTDDLPGAATALKLAVQHSPGFARAQQLLGDLWLEVGGLDQAEARIKAAMSVDPNGAVNADLARLYAYRGRFDEVERVLATARVEDGNAQGWAWLMRGRLSLWREELIDFGPPPPSISHNNILVLRGQIVRAVVLGTPQPPEAEALFEFSLRLPNRRLRAAQGQVVAETMARGGYLDRAMQSARAAVEAGLTDVQWMDRCPAIASLRTHPEWPGMRNLVAHRASKLRAALEAG